jgi:hypothetical protein
MLKEYIQKKHTIDDNTHFTTFNQTLTTRANNSIVQSPRSRSPRSTIMTPRNLHSTIKKEPEIFRDFKIEMLGKIKDPVPEVLETELDLRGPQDTLPNELKTI